MQLSPLQNKKNKCLVYHNISAFTLYNCYKLAKLYYMRSESETINKKTHIHALQTAADKSHAGPSNVNPTELTSHVAQRSVWW